MGVELQQVGSIQENLFRLYRYSASRPDFSHANKLKHGGLPAKMTEKKKGEVI